MTPKTERFEMRLDEETLVNVDRWRAQQGDVPSRAEAMRRLVELGLAKTSGGGVKLSDGEKLIATMLLDVQKQLKVGGSEPDSEFLSEVLFGGHYWALKWQMPGLFHDHEDDPKDVHTVVEVLDMWDSLERAFEKLSKKEREKVQKAVKPFERPTFHGFDGNNESTQMSIARFLIEKMNRFERFKGRELNSHVPLIDAYRRMLTVFAKMRRSLIGGDLDATQIIAVVNAMKHPNSNS